MSIKLSNGRLTVEISELGAEIISIKTHDDTEYIWQGENNHWEGKAPNLFPIVGRLRRKTYIYNGNPYRLGIHGFALTSKFEVESASSTEAVFTLKDNEKTFVAYPFHFIYYVKYTLTENRVTVTYSVKNTGENTMYFSFGAHPGFNVPLHKGGNYSQYYLEFDEECKPHGYSVTETGFLTGKTEPFSLIEDKILPMAGQEIFVPTVFLDNMSGGVTLKSKATRRYVHVRYDDFKYLAIWHDDNGAFICIEPWTGTPDVIRTSKRIEDKHAITALEAGKTNSVSLAIDIG